MANSTLITDYLGRGPINSRPTTLSISTSALGYYWAKDTHGLYAWDPDTSGWDTVVPPMPNMTVLANTSGTADVSPQAVTVTALIDAAIGNTRGAILIRSATGWVTLAPGTQGQFLTTTQGADPDPSWANISIPAATAGAILVATGTVGVAGTITLGTNLSESAGTLNAWGSYAGNLSASGTTTLTATTLSADINTFTTVAVGGIVELPAPTTGKRVRIYNQDAANAMTIWPGGTVAIGVGGTLGAFGTIVAGGNAEYVGDSTTLWIV